MPPRWAIAGTAPQEERSGILAGQDIADARSAENSTGSRATIRDYMGRAWCNGEVMTQTPSGGIAATAACELAGVTYRQLDYWARRGWVSPSVDTGLGRAGRRLYHPGDVVRLAALGHFGQAGLDVGKLGRAGRAGPTPLDRLPGRGRGGRAGGDIRGGAAPGRGGPASVTGVF